MNHSSYYQRVKKKLNQTIDHEQIVVVGVSGGADSMYLLSCLQYWREEQKRTSSSLHIVSCDHNTRDNTKNEIKTVQAQCKHNTFYSIEYTGDTFTEQDLRTRRHTIFIEYGKTQKSSFLVLGHHLDDRIETTFLNLNRGCGKDGLQGLDSITPHFLDKNITIFRPLLTLTKQEILDECHKFHITYHEDPTNTNTSYSQRNMMREILQQNFNTPGFYRSIQNLYTILDTKQEPQHNENNTIVSQEKSFYIHHDTASQYITTVKTGEWTSDLLYKIYQHFHITINPRSTTLDNLSEILNKKSSNKTIYQTITIQSFRYSSIITISS